MYRKSISLSHQAGSCKKQLEIWQKIDFLKNSIIRCMKETKTIFYQPLSNLLKMFYQNNLSNFLGFDTCFYSDTKIFFVKSTLYIMTIKHHIHLASDLCTNRYSSDGKMMFNSKLEDGKSFWGEWVKHVLL